MTDRMDLMNKLSCNLNNHINIALNAITQNLTIYEQSIATPV